VWNGVVVFVTGTAFSARQFRSAILSGPSSTLCCQRTRKAALGQTCYGYRVRSIEATYEQGTLKLAQPLPLEAGERVRVRVVRQPDRKRWDLARLRASDTPEDAATEA
jgi:predicted DNA-binding antitoxin AbrB/MazE fold protein